ncbi:MAG: hypothetical protein AAF600_19735 [Bacteroidota bacterium]
MITASLILNIVVLIPVCLSLVLDLERVKKSAGIFTPARGVLLAMYMTIAIASGLLLFITDSKLVFALFFMQIVYKLLTPITVRTFKNPIVISNVFIAIFHSVTVFTMIQEGLLIK